MHSKLSPSAAAEQKTTALSTHARRFRQGCGGNEGRVCVRACMRVCVTVCMRERDTARRGRCLLAKLAATRSKSQLYQPRRRAEGRKLAARAARHGRRFAPRAHRLA
eukprot:332570-Pleurochrysis_carterae.AAC.1